MQTSKIELIEAEDEIERLRQLAQEQGDRIAKLEAALQPFADIGIGTNPDYEPMIRLPREAILRARKAIS